MAIGLVGQKCGMTRVFNEDGSHVPVSVIKIDPNRITQVKNKEIDGYNAIQVTTGKRKQSKVSKPQAGHYAKAGTEAGTGLWEFRTDEDQTSLTIGENEIELSPGKEINVEYFSVGQIVDVSGTSKGKGFAGTIKRHNFRGQDATHGNSLSHRVPGSTGQNQTPGRVFKGKKMAGQMGNVKKTIQNLEVVKVDAERNLLLVKGSVPGSTSGYLVVKPAVKSQSEEK